MAKAEKGFSKEDGFIVPLLFWIFHFLEKISVFYWVRRINRYCFEHRKNKDDGRTKPFTSEYIFPEIWLALNMAIAIAARPLLVKTNSAPLGYIIGIYSMLRVFELVVYQINVLFFHRLNGYYLGTKGSKTPTGRSDEYVIKSSTRTVIMLILNMIEYVLQFAVMFQAIEIVTGYTGIAITVLDSFLLFTDSGDLAEFKQSPLFHVAYFETMIGVFMNIVCLARFINMLPGVKEKDEK